MISELFSFISHLDSNLVSLANQFGTWIYFLLFGVIFAETGLVVTPFLPGDSLLFAAGAIASTGALKILLIYFLLFIAAVLGDSVNYSIGKYLGKKILYKNWINPKYLEKTEKFYDKHGNKTIVLARFMPIIRTFAPFVAGIGKMHYPRFFAYNIVGAFLWVTIFLFGGFFFGNLPFVKDHFSIIVFTIIFISLIPAIWEFIKYRREK